MDIKYLKDNDLILFEVISGSNAYGINLPESDEDIRGCFYLPIDNILGFDYISQVSDDTNDTTYYEIGRFLELLRENNPNIMELLNSPKDCILYKHPIMDDILKHKDKFITSICGKSFGGYGVTQIKKARSKNKKITNPIAKEKKSPIDFCYVIDGHKTLPLVKYLNDNNMSQKNCGLVNVSNARDIYTLYYDVDKNYKGIIKENDKGELISNQLRLSSISKVDSKDHIINITYNKDGYTTYCKDYREYFEWVKKRNQYRYNENSKHGKGYDGKNMAHCHRLLDMSTEILEGKGINVRRNNREELLSIRSGEYDYDELVSNAENKIEMLEKLMEETKLPKSVDHIFVNELLINIRKQLLNI